MAWGAGSRRDGGLTRALVDPRQAGSAGLDGLTQFDQVLAVYTEVADAAAGSVEYPQAAS